MTFGSLRILVIGDLLPGTGAILRRFSLAGLASRPARNLSEAREMLAAFDFDVVFAAEVLSDGRGYDLAEQISRRAGTLIVAVPLSETCLWLPVVYRGVNVLGRRALSAAALEAEMEELLSPLPVDGSRAAVREIGRRTPLAPAAPARSALRPGPHRAGLPARSANMLRRRYRDRDKLPAPVV